ncbi:hypothetical protein NDU88_002424 [Pleurodeles waltl]|uniref:Uncharacterized protein n=1 Tax=Pleurodeles waltl TaxID=8319 RepID=A0AAV7WNG2_PLEWA|nr:hypothetical protein NDU88_002424 [Pleurodeles waltl]
MALRAQSWSCYAAPRLEESMKIEVHAERARALEASAWYCKAYHGEPWLMINQDVHFYCRPSTLSGKGALAPGVFMLQSTACRRSGTGRSEFIQLPFQRASLASTPVLIPPARLGIVQF